MGERRKQEAFELGGSGSRRSSVGRTFISVVLREEFDESSKSIAAYVA